MNGESSFKLTPNDAGFALAGGIIFDNAVSVLKAGDTIIVNQPASIQIDLKDLNLSDSSSFAVFIAWMKTAKKHNKKIQFLHFPQFMKDVIKVYGLDKILPDGKSWENS